MLWDAFCDADDEGDLGRDSLFDTGGSQGGPASNSSVSHSSLHSVCLYLCQEENGFHPRDKDGCGAGASLLDSLCYVREHGESEMCCPSLLGVCSTNNLGS